LDSGGGDAPVVSAAVHDDVSYRTRGCGRRCYLGRITVLVPGCGFCTVTWLYCISFLGSEPVNCRAASMSF
jgi:hypothetical protein